MRRRAYLAIAGAVLVGGCTGGDGESTPTDTPDPTPNATATDTPTPTATETATETETETETPTAEERAVSALETAGGHLQQAAGAYRSEAAVDSLADVDVTLAAFDPESVHDHCEEAVATLDGFPDGASDDQRASRNYLLSSTHWLEHAATIQSAIAGVMGGFEALEEAAADREDWDVFFEDLDQIQTSLDTVSEETRRFDEASIPGFREAGVDGDAVRTMSETLHDREVDIGYLHDPTDRVEAGVEHLEFAEQQGGGSRTEAEAGNARSEFEAAESLVANIGDHEFEDGRELVMETIDELDAYAERIWLDARAGQSE